MTLAAWSATRSAPSNGRSAPEGPARLLSGRRLPGADPTSVDCIPSDGLTRTRSARVRSAPDGTLWVGSGDAAASTSSIRSHSARTTNGAWPGRSCTWTATAAGSRDTRSARSTPISTHVCTKVWAGGLSQPLPLQAPPGRRLTVGDVGWGPARGAEPHPTARRWRVYGWPCYEGSTRTTGYRDRVECGTSTPRRARAGCRTSRPAVRLPAEGERQGRAGRARVHGDSVPGGLPRRRFLRRLRGGLHKEANARRDREVIVGVDDFASDWSGVDLEPDSERRPRLRQRSGDGSSGRRLYQAIVYSPGNALAGAVASAAPTRGPSRSTCLHRLGLDEIPTATR